MTLHQFRANVAQLPGYDGQVLIWPLTGPAEVTVYWRVGSLPPNILWLMVANLGRQARVVVVFRRWGREWCRWAGPGTRASFLWPW